MNFINDRELARRFRDGKVSSKERFCYFFLSSLAILLAIELAYRSSVENTYLSNIIICINILANLFSLFFFYKINNRGDDEEFIERYISLYFVVGIQVTLYGLVIASSLGMICVFISNITFSDIVIRLKFFDFLNLLSTIYTFIRLRAAFKIAASGSKTLKPEALEEVTSPL